jgi:predicted dehydrogenase
MAKLRAAILGAGLISGKKHLPAFSRLTHKVDLVALCDVNLQAAEKLGQSFGVPRFYSDLADLLDKEKPDLVDICTPPRTHAKLAVQAIRGGANVLIEKPMAVNVAECDEIVQAARECNVKVCVGHSDLFYYPFMKARKLVADGAIGEFRGMRILLSTPTDYMTSRQDHWANKLPGGVIGESGPHVVYMTLAYFNPVRDVTVQAKKLLDYPWSPYEDYRIELVGDKAISSIGLTYSTDQWMGMVDVLGSKGGLLLDLQGQSLIKYNRLALTPWKIGRSMLSNAFQALASTCGMGVRYLTGRLRTTHDILLDRFADSIIQGTPSPVSAEEGREAVRVLNLIVERIEANEITRNGTGSQEARRLTPVS